MIRNHPANQQREAAHAQVVAMLKEFGLTPRSAKSVLAEKPKPKPVQSRKDNLIVPFKPEGSA